MASSSLQSRWRGVRPAVFLSFYNPDMGDTFLSHLRCSLGMAGIHTYLDFDDVFCKEGDTVSLLHKDIKVVVVVFSENYMSQRCCSNDLPQIIECSTRGEKLAMLPVFYGVDPTGIGTQGKRFEEALVIHGNKFRKESAKVERWREALSKTCSLPGCCLNDHGGEAEFIGSIVEGVNNLLACKLSGVQPTSLTTPSQSQEQAGSPQVYVSFSIHDVSDDFLSILDDPDSEVDSEDISRDKLGNFSHSNIEAIKDSWIAIIVVSKSYAYSRRCLEELATITECENRGELIVRLVFHEVDPQEATQMAPSSIAGIQEIDTGTMKRWMGVPPDEERMPDCLWDDDRDEAKLGRRIVEFVEAALITTFKDKSWTCMLRSHEQSDLDDDDDGRYDVFLSFRGTDCRQNIVSHLYNALDQKGIRTFMDEGELEAGEKISEILEALKRSSMAIVVFSKNYAESAWCLNELELMMNQKEKGRFWVIPIFYRVTPGEVRLGNKCDGQKGRYQASMEEKWGNEGPEKVDSWKKALREAGELHGFVLSKE
ncbi:hypothetical protein MLD38_003186 [Melastoma candidum]|uniref:Uncharacterized protein n=1 Tax=Melastoma candidum TaxID=119954 RepID=A0ACB9S354_9MYRT|nr:hypothetical protein MLD38_003186 [Melastoma candidum]